jgi:hypothetical protein
MTKCINSKCKIKNKCARYDYNEDDPMLLRIVALKHKEIK